MQQASDYELELMKIIWANGGTALYAEIVAGLEVRGNSWTKNTIITLLSRLIEKGILKTSKTGIRNSNMYIAVVAENEYKSDQAMRFVDKIFEGNTKGLVAALIENNLLSPTDYEELKNHWSGGDGIQ